VIIFQVVWPIINGRRQPSHQKCDVYPKLAKKLGLAQMELLLSYEHIFSSLSLLWLWEMFCYILNLDAQHLKVEPIMCLHMLSNQITCCQCAVWWYVLSQHILPQISSLLVVHTWGRWTSPSIYRCLPDWIGFEGGKPFAEAYDSWLSNVISTPYLLRKVHILPTSGLTRGSKMNAPSSLQNDF